MSDRRHLREFLAGSGGALLMHPNDLMKLEAQFDTLSRDSVSSDFRTRAGVERPSRAGRVAVLSLRGVIEQRTTIFGYITGGTSTEAFQAAFDSAMADTSVAGILIDCDSPGGTSAGVDELASHIFAARGTKKILAVSNSDACSAAYWIASAADKLFASPGARTGSIGVYSLHACTQKLYEAMGVDWTFVYRGEEKINANEFEPLSENARRELQESVDDCYRRFVDGVARNRGVKTAKVEATFGQGRTFPAQQAKARGLVDGVATYSEVLAMLMGGGAKSQSSSALGARPSVEVLRLRQAQRAREARHN